MSEEEYKEIELTKGMVAKVSVGDYEELNRYNWHANKTSVGFHYASRSDYDTGKKIYMHRAVNKTPEGRVTDHINGDRMDNRRSNLRSCTVSQNLMNRPGHKDSSSRYKGVSFSKNENYWSVEIVKKGKRTTKGGFKCEIEAAKYYDALAVKLHGEFARLNFPEEINKNPLHSNPNELKD